MSLHHGGTVLLLHGNGADGSTVFTDETGKAVTAYGDAKISTAQSKFGGSSIHLDGSGDYLQIAGSNDCNFGIGDFTIECFVNLSAMPTSDAWPWQWNSFMGVVCKGAPSSAAGYNLALGQTKILFNNNDSAVAVGTHGMTTGVWHHIAVARNNGVVLTFVGGLVKGTSTGITTDYTYTQPLLIGTETAEGAWFNGYIADLRITSGIALYTADFTPPTAPLTVFSGNPVQIQRPNTDPQKLCHFDPSQAKPAISEVKNDLQDRQPYGLWKTPTVHSEFKGRGAVTGTVAEKHLPANTPLRRLVRLHREPDGAFVQATWSDATTGAYTFNGVRPDHKFFVTSFDYSGTYRAVIADNLTPTPL